MVARTIPQLLGDMPSGVLGGTSVADMHNLVHTMEARSTVSVKQFGAVGTEVDSSGIAARAAIDTQAFLDATASGASAIYVPTGSYYINPNVWSLPTRTKVFGDGTTSRIVKAGSGWLLDISGFGNFVQGTQTRNNGCILRDIYLNGASRSGPLLRTYYASEILLDKVRFAFNNGPAIDAVEWWDSRIMNCFLDWCGDENTENPAIYLRNSISTDPQVHGYSEDSTNAIYIYGTRIESFKSHAIKLGPSIMPGTDNISQIFITNCKLESHYVAGEFIKA